MENASVCLTFCIPRQQTIEAWRIVFLTAAGVYVVFNTVFLLFGSGEVQPWNTYWETEEGEEGGNKKIAEEGEERRGSRSSQAKVE